MTEFAHTTVLAEEAVRLLAPRPGGVYCDATLGGGGHAVRILEASAPDGRLIGIDRDPAALAAARARLAPFGDRATLVHGRFGDARRILEELGAIPIDGFLLDLGISSPQVDVAARGFSFQKEGPLDMRMDTSRGETAGELLARMSAEDLARIISDYGEEPFARRIARAVKEALVDDRLHTTLDLAAVVAAAIPAARRDASRYARKEGSPARDRLHRKTDPATRTFQALRIAVNDEIADLDRFLETFPDCLRDGGRIAVIAFHSLEDGRVKNRLRDLARHPGLPPDIAAQMGVRAEPAFELLTRKPVTPSEAEVAVNPRARSAKLRAAKKNPEGRP